MDGLKKKRGYWKLVEEAIGLSLWRTRFARCYGPVILHVTQRIKVLPSIRMAETRRGGGILGLTIERARDRSGL